MIQRIQTIYLLLSVAATALLFFLPVWEPVETTEATIDSMGASSFPVLLVIWGIMALVQVITIFLFKNRKTQLTLCQGAILLNILFILMALVFIHEEKSLVESFSIKDFKIGFFLPFASIIFLLMAARGIRKDEELIRSMNRLR